jgi:segregation and condensation protein A
MPLPPLELDLEVFHGPFDLLLALVLREEVDLLEVDLADVVLAYLDHLERTGELDLEATTDFLVLVAALLELKSRLMLPREREEPLELETPEGLARAHVHPAGGGRPSRPALVLGHGAGGSVSAPDLVAVCAAEELLARMLEYARYRAAADHLRGRLVAEHGVRYRSAPPAPELRRATLAAAEAVYAPDALARALGDLLRAPPAVDARHIARPAVSLERRLAHVRALLARRARVSFDECVAGADRLTEAVTLFALLELYKIGEASWEQREPFGPIEVRRGERAAAHAAVPASGEGA